MAETIFTFQRYEMKFILNQGDFDYLLRDISAVRAAAKGKILPTYGRDLIRLIRSDCELFSNPDLPGLVP